MHGVNTRFNNCWRCEKREKKCVITVSLFLDGFLPISLLQCDSLNSMNLPVSMTSVAFKRMVFSHCQSISLCAHSSGLREKCLVAKISLQPMRPLEKLRKNQSGASKVSVITHTSHSGRNFVKIRGVNNIFGAPNSFSKSLNRRWSTKLHYRTKIQAKRYTNQLHAIEAAKFFCSSVCRMVGFVLQLIQSATLVHVLVWMCFWHVCDFEEYQQQNSQFIGEIIFY